MSCQRTPWNHSVNEFEGAPWNHGAECIQTGSCKLVRNYLSLRHVSPRLAKSRFRVALIVWNSSGNAYSETTRTAVHCFVCPSVPTWQNVRLKPKRIWGYVNDKGPSDRSIAAPLTSTKRGRSCGVSASYRGKQRHFDGRLFHDGTGHDRPRPKTCPNGSLKAPSKEVAQSFVTRNPLPSVLWMDIRFFCSSTRSTIVPSA